MPKTFKVGNSGLPFVPPGEYSSTFTGWSLKTLQFGESVQLNFTLNDEKFEGTIVSALAKANITPNTKLGNFVSAFMDEKLLVDSDIDLDSFIGSQGVVTIETKHAVKGDYSVVVKFNKTTES